MTSFIPPKRILMGPGPSNVHADFRLIVGTASVLFSGLSSGAVGGILALANIAPDECIQIYDPTGICGEAS